jgi:hypothetical protein
MAFHRRRVLPLTNRWLRLDEMTYEASVESSRMASAALPTDELLQWVKGTVGKADYSDVVPMRPEQGYVSLVSPLFLSMFSVFPSSWLTSSSPLQGLRGFWTTRTSVPKDATAREVCRLEAEAKKKDEEKKRACKKMLARNSLEKRCRSRAREGLPLEASPSTKEEEGDDDDEGMEVRMGFSPKAEPGSVPTSVDPSGDAIASAHWPVVSLPRARASVEPTPVPASVEEEGDMEGEVAPLPEEDGVAPASAHTGTPQRPPSARNTEEGPITPSCSRFRACSGPDHRSTPAPASGFVEERATSPLPMSVAGQKGSGSQRPRPSAMPISW